MTLEFIDTIPTDVLEEMLEDISLDYPSREDFYESLNEFLSYRILNESASSVAAERQRRLQAAANKNATAEKRRRDKFKRKQTTQKITQGVKGKYDRRPWYKKAFNKLKKWASKGIESLNKKKEDDTTEVVYTTAPATRATSNRATTTASTNRAVTTSNRPAATQQPTPEPPKPKTETQIRAGKLRAVRKATENKKKITYNKFKEKSQAAKFKRMPKPAPSQVLSRTTTQPTPTPSSEPRHPDATGNTAPPAAVRRGNPASPEATRERNRRRPTAPNPPSTTSMRP